MGGCESPANGAGCTTAKEPLREGINATWPGGALSMTPATDSKGHEDSQALSARLKVKVVPGSSRSQLSGWLGDALKVRVAAPPEKGKANAALVALLAKHLGLPRKSVEVVAGHTSQQKTVEIHGLSMAQVKHQLAE